MSAVVSSVWCGRKAPPRRESPRPLPPEEPRREGYDQLDRLLEKAWAAWLGLVIAQGKPLRSPSVGAIERCGLPGPIRRAPSVGGLNRGRRPPPLAPLEGPGSSRGPSSDSRANTPPTRPGSGDADSLSTPSAPGGGRVKGVNGQAPSGHP